jgi:hypothetical protein
MEISTSTDYHVKERIEGQKSKITLSGRSHYLKAKKALLREWVKS